MRFGEILAYVLLQTASLFHGTLDNWVNITNATADNDGGSLDISLFSCGEALATALGDLIEAALSLVTTVTGNLS